MRKKSKKSLNNLFLCLRCNVFSQDVSNHFRIKLTFPWDFFLNSLSGFSFGFQLFDFFNYWGRNAIVFVYVLPVTPDISFDELDSLHLKEHLYGFWDRTPVRLWKLYDFNLGAVFNKWKNVLVRRPEGQMHYSFVWIQSKYFFSWTHNPYFQSISSRSTYFF